MFSPFSFQLTQRRTSRLAFSGWLSSSRPHAAVFKFVLPNWVCLINQQISASSNDQSAAMDILSSISYQ